MNKGLFEFPNFLTSESGVYVLWSFTVYPNDLMKGGEPMNSGETLWYQISLTLKN